MSGKTLTIFIVLILIVIGGIFYYQAEEAIAPSDGEEAIEEGMTKPEDGDGISSESDMIVTDENGTAGITYTDSGFSPKEVTISRGTTVRFENKSSKSFWPASALHPIHSVYSGTTLEEHCSSSTDAFDACEGIASGGAYEFTFMKVGEWGYHDHLKASNFGKVIVTE